MELSRDFNEFIGYCLTREVAFRIVGGYALSAHGHPRYTKDLDVWIRADREHAGRLLGALDDFGFGDVGLTVDEFTARPGRCRGTRAGRRCGVNR